MHINRKQQRRGT